MRDSATPQPSASLHQYLTRHGFAPHPENSAWLDCDTGQQIIRVCHDPGEATLLYCLTPTPSACTRPSSAQAPQTSSSSPRSERHSAHLRPRPATDRPDQTSVVTARLNTDSSPVLGLPSS